MDTPHRIGAGASHCCGGRRRAWSAADRRGGRRRGDGGASARVIAQDLRGLPLAAPWEPGQPIVEGPARRRVALQRRARAAQVVAGRRDPLLDLQSVEDGAVLLRAFATPQLSFDAQSFNGVVPPDPVGDVGPEHYIHATNGPDGTPVTIYDKTTGAIVSGSIPHADSRTAGTGACATGAVTRSCCTTSSPADGSSASSPPTANNLCIYVSRNPTRSAAAGSTTTSSAPISRLSEVRRLA